MTSRLFRLAVAAVTLAAAVPPAEAKECKPVSGPFTTHKGLLFGQDTSTLDLTTGAFTTTVGIVGGTGKYEGAGGQIVATGVFNFATGSTAGTYVGTICKDKKD